MRTSRVLASCYLEVSRVKSRRWLSFQLCLRRLAWVGTHEIEEESRHVYIGRVPKNQETSLRLCRNQGHNTLSSLTTDTVMLIGELFSLES